MIFFIILHAKLIFCVLFCFLNYFISVFMFLCFVFHCFIGNIGTIIRYHGRPARWSTPFWQPTYHLHLICRLIFFMANKLCCCSADHCRADYAADVPRFVDVGLIRGWLLCDVRVRVQRDRSRGRSRSCARSRTTASTGAPAELWRHSTKSSASKYRTGGGKPRRSVSNGVRLA